MILNQALTEIKELGHFFAVALVERGYKNQESDLMAGLAAYQMLSLKGENENLDRAHEIVMNTVAKAAFERVRAA